jgi:integrase
MRIGDLYNLTKKCFVVANGLPRLAYTMSKTGKRFEKVLTNDTYESYKAFLRERHGQMQEENARLFEGTRLGFAKSLNELLPDLTGQKFTCHCLRAFYVTSFFDHCKDMKLTRDAAGHSSLSVTDRYIRMDER